MIPSVFSQRTYPGAGDVDDCWCVSTIWGAACHNNALWRPSITFFRAKAGDPDDGVMDGGSIQECYDGARGCWPKVPVEKYQAPDYKPLLTKLKSGRPASVALDSAALPARLRFNFYGKHQCGVVWDGSRFLLMNPLAPDGSRPAPITQTELLYAMSKLLSPASYRAMLFPPMVAGVQWGWDVDDPIQDAYAARTVALKLRDLGISNYGDRVNDLDLEAGLKARGIDYGSSVQLVDVQALMKPGTGS